MRFSTATLIVVGLAAAMPLDGYFGTSSGPRSKAATRFMVSRV